MDSLLYLFHKISTYFSQFFNLVLGKVDKWDGGKVEQGLNMVRPLLVLLIFVSVSIWVTKVSYTTYRLKNEGVYTSGTVDAYGKGARGNKAVIYSFYVTGKKYTGKTPYDAKINPQLNETYPVMYLPDDPTVNDMEFR